MAGKTERGFEPPITRRKLFSLILFCSDDCVMRERVLEKVCEIDCIIEESESMRNIVYVPYKKNENNRLTVDRKAVEKINKLCKKANDCRIIEQLEECTESCYTLVRWDNTDKKFMPVEINENFSIISRNFNTKRDLPEIKIKPIDISIDECSNYDDCLSVSMGNCAYSMCSRGTQTHPPKHCYHLLLSKLVFGSDSDNTKYIKTIVESANKSQTCGS